MKNILTKFMLLIVAIDTQAVQIHVETDRQSYYAGQKLNVTIMAVNTQSVDVVLEFASQSQFEIAADRTIEDYGGGEGAQAISSVTIPAYGTNVWNSYFAWEYDPLSTGSHTINGLVFNYGQATSEPFLVEQAALPEDKVLVDFNYIPGTDAVIGSTLVAYDALGIHLSSQSGIGNINATLDFPVYSVEVDAFAAVGRQITMIAKDGEGEIIASATSAPISDLQSSQTMRLTGSRRIERLEWWASDVRSIVWIDNLCLYRRPSIFMERNQQMLTLHWPPDVVNSSLEVCTNLEDAVWEPLSSSMGTNEVSVSTTNAASYFYRLRVEEDIQPNQ